MPVVKGGGAPGYRALPNCCCAFVTVSPSYEKMALYIVHPDGVGGVGTAGVRGARVSFRPPQCFLTFLHAVP